MQPFFTEFFFWFCTAIVFYTYLGYGLILYVLVHIKTIFYPAPVLNWEGDLPSITVLIAAYNEEKVVEEKYKEYVQQEDKKQIVMDLKGFNKQEKVIKSRLLLYIISRLFGTTKGIEKIHIEDVIKMCSNNIGNKYLTPNKNIKILLKNHKIYFISQK